jgi:hypothetical protein
MNELLAAFLQQAAAAGRGLRDDTVPMLAGSPVDLANMGLKGVDALRGLMGGGGTPLSSEAPVGGSQWIGDKLTAAGIRPENTDTGNLAGPRAIGGLLGGAAAVPVARAAPGILEALAENAAAPRPAFEGPLGSQIGAVNPRNRTHGTALRSGKAADARASEGTVSRADLIDAPAVVAQRRRMMEESLARPLREFDQAEAARTSYFDRSLIADAAQGHPGVEQQALARLPAGPKANVSHINPILSPENQQLINAQIDRGMRSGGETYYPSTYPIRARYEAMNGPIKFEDWTQANAATSPQAPLPTNIPNATVMLYLKKRGIEPTWENVKTLLDDLRDKHGIGFFTNDGHAKNFRDAQAGRLSGYDNQQKIAGYNQNLLGNYRPYTLDTHETKGLSMGTAAYPYFERAKGVNTHEYATLEPRMQAMADRRGIPAATMQAGRWFGGGELTGLKSPTGDYLNTFEDLVRFNAESRGMDPSRAAMQKYIDRVLQGDEILLPYYRKTPNIEFNRSYFPGYAAKP